MRIIFSGGGTAGHITPAIAIAEELLRRDTNTKILFIGRAEGEENSAVRCAGIEVEEIPIMGLERSLSPKNIKVLACAMRARRRAKEIINDFRPDAVIGTGGYVCWPTLSAAHSARIFTAMHESNAALGLTSRIS